MCSPASPFSHTHTHTHTRSRLSHTSAGTHTDTHMPSRWNPILPGPSSLDSVSIQNVPLRGWRGIAGDVEGDRGRGNPAQGPRAASSFSQLMAVAAAEAGVGSGSVIPFYHFYPCVSCSLSLSSLICMLTFSFFFPFFKEITHKRQRGNGGVMPRANLHNSV